MHAALAYKAQQLKMQKLADWKTALSIRKQNSSHLQDICNAILTKYNAKTKTFFSTFLGTRLRVWEFLSQ